MHLTELYMCTTNSTYTINIKHFIGVIMENKNKNDQPPKAYSTSLRLSPDMHDRLAKIAERTHRSKTFYIQEAINRYLEELEKIYLTEQEQIELKKKLESKNN